jgi:hypothetical protein
VTAAASIAGALLVLVALRDVFDTLLHPHGRGAVSEWLIKRVWRAARRLARGSHHPLSLAGPVAFLAVIGFWGGFVLVGFALIYWPHMPEGFAFQPGLDVAKQGGFDDALYFSMTALASLGTGDVVPAIDGFRILGPLETLIGLALLTAGISWILLLYQVLSDYRALSHEISLLNEAQRQRGAALAELDPGAASSILEDLTSRVLAMRDDLVHSPIAYYFHPRDRRHALPVILPSLIEAVDRCKEPDRDPALQFQATMLRNAIDDLLETVGDRFLGGGLSADEALAAYRHDHLWDSD